jgi:hypothetical protein
MCLFGKKRAFWEFRDCGTHNKESHPFTGRPNTGMGGWMPVTQLCPAHKTKQFGAKAFDIDVNGSELAFTAKENDRGTAN